MRPPGVAQHRDVPARTESALRACLRRPLRFVVRRPRAAAATLVLFLFFTANVLAYLQAYSLTHFVQGVTTTRPDQLSMLGKLEVILTGVRLAKPINAITPATLNLPYETHRY